MDDANAFTFFDLPAAEISAPDFAADGWILDIGAGGEGVIGQLKPGQVIAVDHSWQELVEAPRGPLKLVQDAARLGFAPGSFDTATLFFALMFMSEPSQREVFDELWRVLRPGGSVWIWEAPFPQRMERVPDYPCVHVQIRCPGKTVQTDYARPWPNRALTSAYYRSLAQAAGFYIQEVIENAAWFSIHLIRN
jgi:Methylase involved in ubiquinone/menaquinone biosynthesis